MLTRALGIPLLVILLSVANPLRADTQTCNLDEQMEKRRQSLVRVDMIPVTEVLKQNLDTGDGSIDIAEGNWLKQIWITAFIFSAMKMVATDYHCERKEELEYPQRSGVGWLVEIPSDAYAEIFLVSDGVADAVAGSEDRFEKDGRYLYDKDNRREYRIDSTLDFLIEAQDILLPPINGRQLRLAVSGPYWRAAEWGEEVIGYLRTTKNGRVSDQRYVNYSARHILCIRNGAVSLISAPMDMSGRDLASNLSEQAENCSDAVQIGPNYFEKSGSKIRPGIGGLSRREERRNILVKIVDRNSEEKLFLWSTVGPINPFDAMVVIDKLSRNWGNETTINWAVGLVDDELLSGPVVFDGNSGILALTDTDIRSGGFLLFYE